MACKEITLSELMQLWLNRQKGKLRDSSYASYAQVVKKHILPALGPIPLRDLSANLLVQYKLKLEQNNLSAKTVWDIMTKLDSALHFAVSLGYLEHADFVPKVKLPDPSKPKTLSQEEKTVLIRYLSSQGNAESVGLLLCLTAGISASELCAAKWSDIDLERNLIHLQTRLLRISNPEAETGGKKTKLVLVPTEERDISIPKELRNLLNSLQKPDAAYFLTGKPDCFMETRTLHNYLKKALKACGLPQTINFNQLKATFISSSLKDGANLYALGRAVGAKRVAHPGNKYQDFANFSSTLVK